MVKFSKINEESNSIKIFVDNKKRGQIIFSNKNLIPEQDWLQNIRQICMGIENELEQIENLFISVEQRSLPVDISEIIKKKENEDDLLLNSIKNIKDAVPCVFDACGSFVFNHKVYFINVRNTASAYHAINMAFEQSINIIS